jgi:ketosteroid isomerase-like protein
VRLIYAAWERGDFSSVDWAHPNVEFVFADGPSPESINGVSAMGERWRDYMRNWRDMRAEPQHYHELDEERVLVLFREQGRGRTSGLKVEELRATGANLFHVRDGKVTRLVLYLNGDRALADLGLEE